MGKLDNIREMADVVITGVTASPARVACRGLVCTVTNIVAADGGGRRVKVAPHDPREYGGSLWFEERDIEELRALYTPENLPANPVWRHVKTGGLYHVLGVARCSTNGERDGKEGSVIYFGVSSQTLFYREVGEFLDGRFVPEPRTRRGETP